MTTQQLKNHASYYMNKTQSTGTKFSAIPLKTNYRKYLKTTDTGKLSCIISHYHCYTQCHDIPVR
jgi:hypothetical protein